MSIAARALYTKINRRATRLVKAGRETSALGEFLSLPKLQRGETASKSYERTLRRLDQAEGLRASSARATEIVETRKFEHQMTPDYRATASKPMLARSTKFSANFLTARVAATRAVADDTAHLRKIDETIRGIRGAKSQSALRTAAAAAARIGGYESLSPEYATKALENAREVFGSAYDDWSPDERTAAWETFSRHKESLGSFKAMEEVGTAARSRNVSFAPGRDGRLLASIGETREDAETAAARKESKEAIMRKIASPLPSPEAYEEATQRGARKVKKTSEQRAARRFRI